MVLRVENLHKSYGSVKAVNGVSFEVNEGEVFAILGPNGAGKTTTIKCVVGLRKPDSGIVEIIGGFSYLPERKELYRHLKVKDMIKLAAQYTEGFDLRRANELLELFKLDPSERIANLSHGMLTQLYVSIVFAQDASVYILDEPTWGLDPMARSSVLNLIRDLSSSGKAILYTSHIIPEVEKVADRVAIMNRGRFLVSGWLDELKERYTLISVSKDEIVEGILYKETAEEKIYLVEGEGGITLEDLFEALVRGDEREKRAE